jgi:REP element-mobilizing transposase RayT
MTSKKLKSPVCPDRYYHIYNRGNNRDKLFYHSGDYCFFLAKYKEYVAPFTETYAYCLLPNHFHFLIKTRNELPNTKSVVSNQFRKLFISYTKRINFMQSRTGGLFTKNFQRIEIQNERYFIQLVNYIHKNPVKHGIQNNYKNYIYSSYGIIVGNSDTYLNRDEVIDWFGGKLEFIQYHESDAIDPKTFNMLNIEEDEMESRQIEMESP